MGNGLATLVANGLSTIIANGTAASHVVGNAVANFWLFSHKSGYDLTHPSTPSAPPVTPRFQLRTSTEPITIAPTKTALVIIDMQNFFLSDGLNNRRGEGHDAEDLLISHAIPAARRAGIQIIHVTWGITEEELAVLPPVIFRIFGYDETKESFANFDVGRSSGKEYRLPTTVGDDLGDAEFPDGTRIPAGRMLMRDQWNTGLHAPLQKEFENSQTLPRPDVRFHKSRLSGFWGGDTPALRFLRDKNITTLLFSGVNTDQCVLASLQDACNLSFDTIILKDGCGTDSPGYATKMVEYNCRKSWGFVSSCTALAEGVKSLKIHD